MAARFRPSHRGIGELLRSEMIRRDLVRRANRIKSTAETIAPVGGPGDPHPGRYKASVVVTSTTRGGRRRDRAVAYATNTAPYARWVEYGTERVPAHHVMLRAARAGGD
ncbi:HK97 gp10 family phage protein [Streptomyces sp. NPDC047315]|uniref:HK97 gp10 family phage protein n=1 Tax=Streptomyces sp. NPDC047315 TaxID=3155142 RepID=UPI00340A8503